MDKTKITSSEPKNYLGISVKRLIGSLGLKFIRRSKNVKKENLFITEASLKDISKIVEEFKDMPYEGYLMRGYKHMPTYSYFYLSIQISKCMMINFCGLVKMQKIKT